jgi:hypothetical protein
MLARADDADEGDYNIWYHKKAGRRARGSSKVAAKTRCVGARDSGGTRGSDARALTFCLHFARGCCVRGHACHYLHRVPCAVDENELEARCDIFGRERHATDREDMGGVGSFTSDSRTLYVGGLAGGAKAGVRGGASPLRDALSRQFGEWGRVESLRVFPGHAFVTFVLRACAEFAREAMQNQSLGVGDGSNAPRLAPILNVRWATDDPNPRATRRTRAVAASALVAAAAARAPPLPPPPRAASSARTTPTIASSSSRSRRHDSRSASCFSCSNEACARSETALRSSACRSTRRSSSAKPCCSRVSRASRAAPISTGGDDDDDASVPLLCGGVDARGAVSSLTTAFARL